VNMAMDKNKITEFKQLTEGLVVEIIQNKLSIWWKQSEASNHQD